MRPGFDPYTPHVAATLVAQLGILLDTWYRCRERGHILEWRDSAGNWRYFVRQGDLDEVMALDAELRLILVDSGRRPG